MKILHINASYKPAYIYGGPTMSVSQLCENLQAAGCLVQVFTTTANGATELDVPTGRPININGVTVTYFRRLTKDHSHFSPSLLKQVWLQVKNFDIVHIHAWWNTVSVLSCLIALLRNKPVILSPRGTLSYYTFTYQKSFIKRLFHAFIGKPLLTRCTVHTTSLTEAQSIRQLFRPKAIFEIFNFVNIVSASAIKKTDEGALKLLYFSRIHPKKGLHALLTALPYVNKNWRLTVAGNGDDNYIAELKQVAVEKGIASHIDWVGFIGDDRKFDLMARHNLFILPSADENFANVVIECLSVGTPVIISPQVGLVNYVEENKLGIIASSDEKSLSNAINQLAANTSYLSQINKTAPQIIQRNFNPTVLIDKYLNMYRKTLQHE